MEGFTWASCPGIPVAIGPGVRHVCSHCGGHCIHWNRGDSGWTQDSHPALGIEVAIGVRRTCSHRSSPWWWWSLSSMLMKVESEEDDWTWRKFCSVCTCVCVYIMLACFPPLARLHSHARPLTLIHTAHACHLVHHGPPRPPHCD
jgi:hypothetical protein